MPYIGNKSDTAFTSLEKQDFSNPSGTSLTLTHAVANANDIALYINNVRQEPTEAYSVNGTTVTLTGSVSNSDDIYAVYLARAVQTTVPPDGSVSSVKLATNSVTSAKIEDGAITTAKLNASITLIPTGMIAPFPTSGVPTGWLECNGAAVSRTTYADLFALISDDYGNGDGSSTFNLPDLRGQFIRGFANGQSTDPDRASRTDRGDGTTGDAVGTKQDHAVEQHSHRTPATSGYNGNTSNTTYYSKGGSGYSSSLAHGGPIWTSSYSSNPNIKVSSNETRPKNVSMLYCIKT
tara:strand:+ start:276 stop:1154 length:879 start_codon:yes stop_codon:yes gene_type:complete